MQTRLDKAFSGTPEGQEADVILRSCVHCGFCTATCPTYQLLGDELDGPRGRIYLIKQLLEGQQATEKTQMHLDRCLTCRACETTCPSGVQYGHLVDIGRAVIEQRVTRPWRQRLLRRSLRALLPQRRRFAALLALGRLARPILPAALQAKIPAAQVTGAWPPPRHMRRMLVLAGCVQPAATPATNAATARVLDRLGISLLAIESAGCCGGIELHMGAKAAACTAARRNIDAWWPHVEAGIEAIVITASGCGVTVKDYGHLLQHDPAYADKAARISALARDPVEVLAAEDLSALAHADHGPIAVHAPCTLQHGQQLPGALEGLLSRLGFTLTEVPDAHLCCGSAGAYSLLEPAISGQLLDRKLAALEGGGPELIVTANIGCQMHLASRAGMPVCHWIELLDKPG